MNLEFWGNYIYWLSQIVITISLILALIAFQCKKHKHIVTFKMASEVVSGIHYLMLEKSGPAILNCISGIRNYIFYKMVKKGISTLPVIIGFSIFVAAVGAYTFSGLISLMPIVAKILSTVSYGMKNEKILRLINVFVCVVWLVYNSLIGSFMAVVSDIITFISLAIGIYRYDIRKSKVL